MSEFENNNAVELNENEMNEIAGGAFKRPSEKEGFIVYQIQKGDNLNRIAIAHHCTVKALLQWNPKIHNKNLIIVGDYLYIKA